MSKTLDNRKDNTCCCSSRSLVIPNTDPNVALKTLKQTIEDIFTRSTVDVFDSITVNGDVTINNNLTVVHDITADKLIVNEINSTNELKIDDIVIKDNTITNVNPILPVNVPELQTTAITNTTNDIVITGPSLNTLAITTDGVLINGFAIRFEFFSVDTILTATVNTLFYVSNTSGGNIMITMDIFGSFIIPSLKNATVIFSSGFWSSSI